MNLIQVADRLLAGPPVTLKPELCLRTRWKGSDCQGCLEACPAGAVSLGPQGPELNPEACTACGLCMAACPSGAFTVPSLNPEQLVPALGEGAAALTCSRGAGENTLARVACLRALSPEWLAGVAAERELSLVLPDGDGCSGCPLDRSALPAPEEQVGKAAELLQDLGLPGRVRVTRGWQAGGPASRLETAAGGGAAYTGAPNGISRRGFLGWLRTGVHREAAKLAADSLTSQPAGSWPGLPPDRQYLLGVLARRTAVGTTHKAADAAASPEPATVAEGSPTAPPAGAAPGCTACGACVQVCPTQALRLDTADGAVVLHFHPQRCLDCQVCTAACPAALLTIRFEPAWLRRREPLALAHLHSVVCSQCGQHFTPAPRPTGPSGSSQPAAAAIPERCPECEKVERMTRELFPL